MTIPRLRFWHIAPGNPGAREAVKEAAHRAFMDSPRGQKVLAFLRKDKHRQTYCRVVSESRAFKVRASQEWALYLRMQQSDLLNGVGNGEHIMRLHSWMGHLLFIAVRRMRRLPQGTIGYQELRQNTLPLICRGRRALAACMRRWNTIGKADFSEAERRSFIAGYAEAELLSQHASRREMRAAYEYAERLAKAKGYVAVKAEFHY